MIKMFTLQAIMLHSRTQVHVLSSFHVFMTPGTKRSFRYVQCICRKVLCF